MVPERGSIELEELGGPVASIDDAEGWPARGVLLDVRAPERYRGETEPYDPIAGHIPGAVNLPAGAYLEGEGFAAPEAIREALAGAGVTDGSPVAAYCGSGLTAAHLALAGAVVGRGRHRVPRLVEPVVEHARPPRRDGTDAGRRLARLTRRRLG